MSKLNLPDGVLSYSAVFRRADDGATVEFPAFGGHPIPLLCGWRDVSVMAHPAFEELLFLCWRWREEHDGELPECDKVKAVRGGQKATATFRFRADAVDNAVTVRDINIT